MTFYEITEEDRELIEAALSKLESNFDSEKYNHTVGAAIKCKNGNIFAGKLRRNTWILRRVHYYGNCDFRWRV